MSETTFWYSSRTTSSDCKQKDRDWDASSWFPRTARVIGSDRTPIWFKKVFWVYSLATHWVGRRLACSFHLVHECIMGWCTGRRCSMNTLACPSRWDVILVYRRRVRSNLSPRNRQTILHLQTAHLHLYDRMYDSGQSCSFARREND